MPAKPLAQISGVFLEPGVSRNGRWYRPEVVRAAVENMQQRIAQGGLPITMATSHAAGRTDDAMATIGAIREAWVDDGGKARFRADIPNTTAGRDAHALLEGKYAGGVSIDADWFNVRRMVAPSGQVAEAGDNLFVKRIDLTGNTGVTSARVDSVSVVESVNHATGAVSITESFDEALALTDGEHINEAVIPCAHCGATSTGGDAARNAAESAPSQETQVTEQKATSTAETATEAATAPVTAQPVELSESAVKAIATAVGVAVAEAMKPATPAVAAVETAPTTETATPLTESAIQTLISDGMKSAAETLKAEVRAELAGSPFFGRIGRVATSESAAEETPESLAKLSNQELRDLAIRDEAGPYAAGMAAMAGISSAG